MIKLLWFKAAVAAIFLTLAPLALGAEVSPETSAQISQLDINSADAASIAEALDGIGLVKAGEIVAYREMFGKFRSVDELVEVQGIGAATVEKNRHLILIVDSQ